MTTIRLIGCILLLSLCMALPEQPIQSAEGGPPPGENTITITTIDTGTKGQVNLAGTFTTKDANTTLDSIMGFGLPTSGGAVRTGGGKKQVPAVVINQQTKAWTSVIITDLRNQSYSFRVEGTFSDSQKKSSQYYAATPSGNGPPIPGVTVSWTAGFPKSTQPLKISSEGTFTGNPDGTVAKFVYATPFSGGSIPGTGDITLNNGNMTWSAVDITVATSGQYSVFAVINGVDGETYCSPYANAYPGN
jgi:hypothetical protein